MIASLRIKGLAAHDLTTIKLNPTGVSEVEGASATGKTSLIEAVCFVFWGTGRDGKPFPVEAIREDVVEVDVVTAKGTTMRRTMRRNRSQTRIMIAPDGSERTFPNEDAWREAIKALGRNVEVLRHVVVPDAWVALAHGKLGGLPLRDLLASLTPGVGLRSVVEQIMLEKGHAMGPADPVEPKAAEALRKAANSARDTRQGAVEADSRSVDALMNAAAPESQLNDGDIEAFTQVLVAAEAWRQFDADVKAAHAAAQAVEEAKVRAAQWAQRKAALGERPEAPASGATIATGKALKDAADLVTQLERDRATAQAAIGTAEHLLHEAERADDAEFLAQARKVKEYKDALDVAEASGDTCSHCKRPGWDQAAKALETSRATLRSAQAFLDALGENAPARKEERLKPLRAKVEQAKAKEATFAPKLAEAKAASEAAAKANLAMCGRRDAVIAYDKALAALGAEPVVGELPAAVVPPSGSRPEAAEIAEATKALGEHQQALGAIAERERAIEDAKSKLMQAETSLATAKAEAARCTALVEAVRAAPSTIARQQLDTLGDLGPLTLELLEDGAVTVLVDGRPWWLASTGRQIVADAAFRVGLRRACKLLSLPIFVDEVQSVGGCELRVEGPAVLLRTTDDATITVRKAARVAA